ncbi:hypothetical protein N7450_009075 [Penicillium hetheringtonii]|uniref:Transcription factor domain-containing protein n=1 Tax=Penicillium hetheringtonii TaxID=911720 RepID=A0AAD6GPX9_9EURO|nr:hypothetical protein N7450_009075 [Penicillium hetheringtonii]
MLNQAGHIPHDRNHTTNSFGVDSIRCRGIRSRTTSMRAPSFQTWPFMSDLKFSPYRGSVVKSRNEKAHNERLTSLVEILHSFRFLHVIEKLLQDYFTFINTAIVSKLIILQLLDMTRNVLTDSGYLEINSISTVNLHKVHQLAQDILDATSLEVIISPTMDIEGLSTVFSGRNLRVGTLGMLYTQWLHELSSVVTTTMKVYAGNVGRSDSSLRLAHEIPPQTTYPVIWLAHENLQLMSIIEGDASLGVWRRVSDLATDLFALGLNREATYSPELIPLFLAECRRKIFARAYYLDKYSQRSSIAPPRISSRQTDCKLPLDIPHDAPLTTSLETLSEIQHNLSHNDWDADGIISTVTWARLRCILGEFRVEIAEYQIRSTPAVDADKLRCFLQPCFKYPAL